MAVGQFSRLQKPIVKNRQPIVKNEWLVGRTIKSRNFVRLKFNDLVQISSLYAIEDGHLYQGRELFC